jgi:D-alanine--poly(phosphoribitol) ligase subunit 2
MEDKVIEMLVELCGYEEIRTERDIDLFRNGFIDSLGFINMIIEIELRFGVVIDPADVDRDEINTPNKVVAYITKKIAAQ